MKAFKFFHSGYILSYKELMEMLRLNDEKVVKLVNDDDAQTLTIYTEYGSIGTDVNKIKTIGEDKNEI